MASSGQDEAQLSRILVPQLFRPCISWTHSKHFAWPVFLFVGTGLWGLGSGCLWIMWLHQPEWAGELCTWIWGRVLQSHLAKKCEFLHRERCGELEIRMESITIYERETAKQNAPSGEECWVKMFKVCSTQTRVLCNHKVTLAISIIEESRGPVSNKAGGPTSKRGGS